MRIHKQIREEVLAVLQDKVDGVVNYYNGRPTFVDIDEEQCALVVFLDEMTNESVTICNDDWQATLNISIYLKSPDGEAAVDDIAQQIRDLMGAKINEAGFESLTDIVFSGYRYEQDTTNRTWFVGNLTYQIQYED